MKPIALAAAMSKARASSLGAVYRPSGHQPWSSRPFIKYGLPLSVRRFTPFLSSPTPTLRSAK